MGNLGMRVRAVLVVQGVEEEETLRNVTEIHYNYDGIFPKLFRKKQVAFESDIHHTGITYDLEENPTLWIKEFEARLETEKAGAF